VWRQIGTSHYSVSDAGKVRDDHTGYEVIPKMNAGGYLVVYLKNVDETLVHRLVCGAFHDNPWKLPIVDHINRIRTDNRLFNLRWASVRQNNMNRSKSSNATSKYFGVSKTKSGRWRTKLRVDGKDVSLGTWDDENEAGQAYNSYVIANQLPNNLNVII
jgi:hypothetical protein